MGADATDTLPRGVCVNIEAILKKQMIKINTRGFSRVGLAVDIAVPLALLYELLGIFA